MLPNSLGNILLVGAVQVPAACRDSNLLLTSALPRLRHRPAASSAGKERSLRFHPVPFDYRVLFFS